MATSVTGKATEFIQFTRASNATVTDSDGKVKWAPHNLLTNSESFDASAWTKTNLTINANNTGAPNGTTTADALFETTTNAAHQALQTQTVLASTTYTVGVFVKANGRTKGGVGLVYTAGSFDGFSIDFDLVAQTATPSINGTGVCTNSGITSLGNGWFYVFGTGSIGNFTSAYVVCKVLNDAGAANYAGDITKGLIFWGAHLYRSDLGGMQANTSAYPMYNPTTPKNLLGFTESFDNAGWSTNTINNGITANSTVAPNGLNTADLLFAKATNTIHVTQQLMTVVSGTTYVASVYAKAGGYLKIGIRENASTGAYATFDLSSGTVIAQGAGGTGAISSVGNGWYRISMSSASGSTSFLPSIYIMDSGYSSGSPQSYTYTGDGTSGIYLWGAQLSDSASLDPYIPVYGAAVTSAAYYGPRRDFDSAGVCRGLLVEEQRTNLLLHSNAFNNAIWTAYSSALSTTDNSALGPDGLTSASTVTLSANTRIQILSSLTNGATYTLSVWMRTDSGTKNINLVDINDTASPNTVTVTTTWTRFTFTYAKTNTISYVGIRQTGGTSPSTSGTLYVWGWQYELGSFATSYIPVGATTAGATRNGDVASVSTQAFPYADANGTLVVSSTLLALSTAAIQSAANLGTDSNNQIYLYANNTAGSRDAVITTSGGGQGFNSIAGASSTSVTKQAFAWAVNDTAHVVNASAPVTDPSVSLPTGLQSLRLGVNTSNANALNGHIRQITYIPRRLTNAELQTRTA